MRLIALVFAVVGLGEPVSAAAPVPANGIISQSGDYYLTADRTSAGSPVIQIWAPDVDLNMKGRTVRCAPADPTTATNAGIQINAAHATVRNGAVTGCFAGINGFGDAASIINMDLSANTYMGANIVGNGTKVIGSVFQGIGGYKLEAYAIGVNGLGPNCVVERNTFRLIYRQALAPPALGGEGVGILLSEGYTGCVIRDNFMENGLASNAIGIWLAGNTSAYIAENTIINFGGGAVRSISLGATIYGNNLRMKVPGQTTTGIRAPDGLTVSDNLILGFDIPLIGALDGGGNLILP